MIHYGLYSLHVFLFHVHLVKVIKVILFPCIQSAVTTLCGGYHKGGVELVSLFYSVTFLYNGFLYMGYKVLFVLLRKKVIGKGIEPHPTNEYHLSILSYLLVI